MDKLKMTQSSYVPTVGDSRLGFFSPSTTMRRENLGQTLTPYANQIFLKSLNMSTIGRISGQTEMFQQIDRHELETIQEDSATPRKRRIDFEGYHATLAKQEMQKSKLSQDQYEYLYLSSFQDHENAELLKQPSCGFLCDNEEGRKRYCRCKVVDENSFELYARGEGAEYKELILSINFDTVNVKLEYERVQENKQFSYLFGKYKLLLQHDRKEVTDHWFGILEGMYNQSKGKELSLVMLNERIDFYKERMQTEEYFVKNAQTGDVILFQDDHFFAKAQRFITRSDYDHVGMIIKDPTYGLLIYEANSGTGVGLTPWRYVIRYGWYRSIPKITWRRLLDVERDYNFNEKIEKFVKDNLTTAYHISFSKLLAHESYIHSDPAEEDSGEKGEKKATSAGFFCSELVATVYKELGLLTRDRTSKNYMPACNFYPKDFSERAERELDVGKLSPEYTIAFDPKLLKVTYKGMIHE